MTLEHCRVWLKKQKRKNEINSDKKHIKQQVRLQLGKNKGLDVVRELWPCCREPWSIPALGETKGGGAEDSGEGASCAHASPCQPPAFVRALEPWED